MHVILTGGGGAEGWLDIDRDGITVCKNDQGKDVDLVVQGDTAHMYKWLAGIVTFREIVGSGQVRLIGPSQISRAFPTWFTAAPFGKELRHASRQLAGRPA